MRKRRKSGWTAFIIALVAEVAVLGAVGIYGSVAGGPTFQSRAFVNRVLSSPSATPSPADVPAVAADPVEVDACTGVGDEAYVLFVPIDELVQAYFYVRDGKRVFEVSYSVLDEGLHEPPDQAGGCGDRAAEVAALERGDGRG